MSTVAFHSPSYRAGSSDLTIAVTPLGLVELSDEEFEVHGPRLNRYASYWAFYLGHHWSYRREDGEPQITFNYTRALADWMNNFTFGQGVRFSVPKATEAILPALLERIWTVDNDREMVLWEMGQTGGVTGDCFVKVAYEEPWVDVIGRIHPGRVRILPLNPSHCYPEWHPHDRTRLTRFKLKYRFWGTTSEGTRQVFTYTEIITDNTIQEYVNDELIDERPNPLGTIPVEHIPNMTVSGSPWGISDIQDVTSLNREFNEKATDISDIINYGAEPVTVITGAKASHLEKASNKVWAGLPADAKVSNLEGSFSGMRAALEYLLLVKQGMHEMTGVPEGALGQKQAISNTSGVALAIQYQPAMNRWRQKTISYARGIRRINELAILTIAVKEPHELRYNPTVESELKPGQYAYLDPSDPLTYRTFVSFPPPLPLDVLVKLNEIQAKMALGLESKRGALAELGHEHPDEKMNEIFEELVLDAEEQGALDMLRAHIQASIAATLGMPMVPEGGDVTSTGSSGGGTVTQAGQNAPRDSENVGPLTGTYVMPQGVDNLLLKLSERAFGTKLSQRRNPQNTVGTTGT